MDRGLAEDLMRTCTTERVRRMGRVRCMGRVRRMVAGCRGDGLYGDRMKGVREDGLFEIQSILDDDKSREKASAAPCAIMST